MHTFLPKMIYLIGFIILLLVLSVNVLYTCTVTLEEKLIIKPNNIFLSILATIFVFLVILLIYKLCDFFKNTNFLFFTLSIDVLILLAWVAFSKTSPFADQLSVYNSAINISQNNYIDFFKGGYIYQYNHQATLAYMFSLFLRLFSSNYKVLQVLISLCTLGTHLGIFKITKELYNEKAAKTSLIISMLFLPTTILTIYVYGDIIGLCLSIWAIYFTIIFLRQNKVNYLIYTSLLIGIAILFRNNTLVFWLAMVIYLFTQLNIKKFIIALCIMLTSLCYNYSIKQYLSYKAGSDLTKGIPSILFVNMGLEEGPRGNGWYNGSTVVNYESANDDSKQAKTLGLKLVNKRISYMLNNPMYSLNFFAGKFITTWSEPTYESLFFTFPHDQSTEVINYMKNNLFLNSLYYGTLNKLIIWYCKGFVLFIAFGATVCCFKKSKDLTPEILLILLPFIGTVAFHLMWETKSRYVYPAFVLLFPLASIYFTSISDKLSSRLIDKSLHN
ncbi:hypothetical protein bsdtw1_03699 [Clostridium fungisolvens]|uniref:Glycosyltransferase RgtA/B/C/D-like domain-containing protein n=2 Tax=Clostridium fungisolvens TaxID=1604897 RepID=A0A6V8SLW7_9CLOT|nr:hypothetical protein bsdtw1_03699 [Clostridium fungisolvens]